MENQQEAFLTFDNRLALSAEIGDRSDIRYTPAGVQVLSVNLMHQSMQMEADTARRVDVTVPAIAIGKIAEEISRIPLDKKYLFKGFISTKNIKSSALLFHITGFSLIE